MSEPNSVTVAKLATESLKATSPFVDTLLGAKLKRWKIWADGKELSSRVRSKEVAALMRGYMRQLLTRISGLRTVIFPSREIPLAEIYEPMRLVHCDKENDSTIEFNYQYLSGGKNYLIVDSAGMGKSTFSKYLVLEMMDSSTITPVFLELRRIGEDESLLERICKDIDKSGKWVDIEVIDQIIDWNDVALILDGFDEVPEERRASIGAQITDLAVRHPNTSFLLTSRPQIELPHIPNCTVLRLKPLSRSQSESLVKRYDSFSNLDVGKRLIKEFNSVPRRFLETPLLVALLYKTFSYNHSIATRLSTFYSEMYEAIYKGHDLSKYGFYRDKRSNLDFDSFRVLLRGFSFFSLAHRKDVFKSRDEVIGLIEKSSSMTNISPTSSQLFLDDLLQSVPFLIQEGLEYRFIHKSIKEYFSAEYISNYPDTEKISNSILNGPLRRDFRDAFEFIADLNIDLYRKVIVLPFSKKGLDCLAAYPDLLLSTVEAMAGCIFGVWKVEKGTKEDSISRDKVIENNAIILSNTPEGFLPFHTFEVESGGTTYNVQIAFGLDIIPQYACSEICEFHKISSLGGQESFDDLNVEGIEKNVWIYPNHDDFMRIFEDEFIQRVTTTYLRAFFGISSSNFRNRNDMPFLSGEKCSWVINEVEKVESNKSMIDSFLASITSERG